MKNRQIVHRGVVESIKPQGVVVGIMQEVACSSCAAASLCHVGEGKHRSIVVECNCSEIFVVGQQVRLVGQAKLGLRATLWAYAVPLASMVAVLIVVTHFTDSEGWGALAALLSLVPYYTALYLLRERLQRKFSFTIEKL